MSLHVFIYVPHVSLNQLLVINRYFGRRRFLAQNINQKVDITSMSVHLI